MINLFQLLNGVKNPQQFIQQLMGNNQIMSSPITKNVIEMYQSGNVQGIEQLARNLCKEKKINADEFVKQIKNQFGM